MYRVDASEPTPRTLRILSRFSEAVANAFAQGRSKDISGKHGLAAQAEREFIRTEQYQEIHQTRPNRFPNLRRAFTRLGKPVPSEIEELSR